VTPPASATPRTSVTTGISANDVFRCGVEKLKPMRGQPRQHFDPTALEELATSIKNHGLIEPLVVRQVPGQDEFEIIAGERRWRAAQKAGLLEVLVVVREASSPEAFELALIENAQREDLDPIEFAEALERLVEERGYTQEALATQVGKERSTVANAMRLLKLPGSVRALVAQKKLSEGHARALLGLPDVTTMQRLAEKIVSKGLSVRQTEAIVKAAKRAASGDSPASPGAGKKSAGTRDLEHRLTRKLGARCEVRDRAGKGELLIHYSSLDELDRLIEELL
jgi:ParB family transcriptional regulator, chromosome partitioning protein